MSSLFLLLGSFLGLLSLSQAVSWPTPTITTNASTVALGQAFSLHCSLGNFQLPSDSFYIRFHRDNDVICVYRYPAGSSSTRQPTISLNPSHKTDLEVISLSTLGGNPTIAVIPKTLTAHSYRCDNPGPYSPSLPINVVQNLAIFSTNTTKPQVGVPFTATCNVTRLPSSIASRDFYAIHFFSKAYGLLASFEHKNGENIALIREHDNFTIHHGARTAYPLFDVTITERVTEPKGEYWCSLETTQTQSYPSNHWGDGPILSFTSARLNSTTQHGSCYLDNFKPAGGEYSVAYRTSVGPKSVNQLGYYLVKPNEILEFDSREVTGWGEIAHVAHSEFPTFGVLASASGNSSSINGTWWCVLGVGAQGSASYREYNSSRVDLV